MKHPAEPDNVQWHALTHAYGSAEDVPELIRALYQGDEETAEEAIHELRSFSTRPSVTMDRRVPCGARGTAGGGCGNPRLILVKRPVRVVEPWPGGLSP
ncbi:hypothetical protein [Streptomyces sp. NPDC096311]|uniref:hypothetical protein n=1 Tax=Streptomyces sp. NPDC096311 TaxID=3366083 RepID=UPI00382B3E2B